MANTQNYGFSLPQGWDGPGAAERRRDHTAVDKAIRAVADNAATRAQMTAAQNRLSALEGRCRVQVGTFLGNGEETQTISLGTTPKGVLVEGDTGQRSATTQGCYGGLALPGLPVRYSDSTPLEIVTGGFRVAYKSGSSSLNQLNRTGRYIAFL